MNQLEDFLMPTQKELFQKLCNMFGKKAVSRKGSYILIPGEAPVMLLAHLDTVHGSRVKQICKSDDGNVLMSPQGIGGDDRCGVYALVTAHKLSKVKPWLLFTCDEETGGKGASEFCTQYGKGKLPEGLDSLKALVEIDRKGKSDAVYYDCANKEFEEYITGKGFKTAFGSFSDISFVAPELGVAAVNLSSGYYNAHTRHEYIDRKHLSATIKKVVEIIDDSVREDFPRYEYVEAVRHWRRMSYGGYGSLWDDDDFGKGAKGSGFRDYGYLDDVYYPCDEDYDQHGVPDNLRGAYEELLDFYGFEELEEYRADYGDNSIQMLYASEFGKPYGSLEDDGGAKAE